MIHAFMVRENQQNKEDVQKDPRFCHQLSPKAKYRDYYVKECCSLL